MGFFDSISKGWQFTKQAIKMGFENRVLFKPSIYLVLVTILYIAAWIAGLIAVDFQGEDTGTSVVVGALCTFGSFLIFYFFCGMTVNMVDAHLENKAPSVGEA